MAITQAKRVIPVTPARRWSPSPNNCRCLGDSMPLTTSPSDISAIIITHGLGKNYAQLGYVLEYVDIGLFHLIHQCLGLIAGSIGHDKSVRILFFGNADPAL